MITEPDHKKSRLKAAFFMTAIRSLYRVRPYVEIVIKIFCESFAVTGKSILFRANCCAIAG